MSKPQDFMILDGVLLKYKGLDPDVVIPDGVTQIGDYAFSMCTHVTSVVIPDGVTVIGDSAFAYCARLGELILPESVTSVGAEAFLGCNALTRLGFCGHLEIGLWYGDGGGKSWGRFVAQMHRNATDAALKKYVLERVWDELSVESQADVFVAHQSKSVLDVYRKCVKDAAALGRQILAQLPDELSAKEAAMVANYIQLFASEENTVIRPLYQRLQGQKKAAKALAKLENDPLLMPLLRSDEHQTLSPLESALGAALEARGVTRRELPALVKRYYSLTESDLPTLKDGEGNDVSAHVLMYLLIAHETDEYYDLCAAYKQPGLCPEAAAVVAQLDPISFQKGLLALAGTYLGMTGRSKKMFLAYPICRYGDEDTMRRLTAVAPKWRSSVSGNDAPPLLTFRRANRYSNTRAAMLFADKYQELIEYARLRGTDADTIRDLYLSDVGLDAQGRREYDLGNQTVTVELQRDLSFLVLLPDGKTAKSLPKKGADEAKYAAANDHFSEMRKSVKRIVKNRKDLLFDEFLTGKKRPAASWQAAYLQNPVLRSVARLLVWAQDTTAFTVTDDGLITTDGSAYTLTDAPIAVAHPAEMAPASVAAWQTYFLRHGLKQPFEQVWEPVVDWSTVKSDRYVGCRIPYYRFVGQSKRGIIVEDCDFHNEIDITIYGFHAVIERLDWERHHIDMHHCFEIKSFLPGKRSRLGNHLVAYFDRCTLYERILKDDVTIVPLLSSFTAAQIAAFIKVASENGCTQTTALLLEYQQAHFADVDPMAEFTLD